MSEPSSFSAHHEVHLAIYDLSRGMARQLSVQFLGADHALDLIPHTGIRVYGKEYYFGGGIQRTNHLLEFQSMTGLLPIKVQSLGHTTKTMAEFEDWCTRQQQHPHGRFAATSYDLLHRNCNHFSHEAAVQGLGLVRGVPDWVLDVPQRFLSSPMGQFIRPMLEQMQIANTSPVGPMNSSVSTTTAPESNPWESFAVGNLPPTSARTSTPFTATSATTLPIPNPWEMPPKPQQEKSPLITPVLDSFYKPLISRDTRSIPVVVRKLTANLEDEDQKALSNLGSLIEQAISNPSLLGADSDIQSFYESQSATIETSLSVLRNSMVGKSGANLTFALMLLRLVVLVIPSLETTKTNQRSSSMLQMILEWMQRQIVNAVEDDVGNTNEGTSRLVADASNKDENGEGGGAFDTNLAARSMAWCVLSNLVSVMADKLPHEVLAHQGHSQPLVWDKQELIDAAIRDMTTSNSQVRQTATCFLYNIVLAKINWTVGLRERLPEDKGGLDEENDAILLQDDLLLSILCACVEEFSLLQLLMPAAVATATGTTDKQDDMYDPTTCLRRLAVIGRILVPVMTAGKAEKMTKTKKRCDISVRQFLLDLGLDELLRDHVAVEPQRYDNAPSKRSQSDTKKELDADQCRKLATELQRLLQLHNE